MATDKGVWDLQQVRDKQLQSLWPVPADVADNHTFWSWGYGNSGQLGHNETSTKYSSPVQIGSGTDWMDIGGVKGDGTLWSWGVNTFGEMGVNDTTERSSPVQVGSDTTWKVNYIFSYNNSPGMAVKTDGTLWSWGFNSEGTLGLNDRTHRSSPTQVGSDTTWPQIRNQQKFGWSWARWNGAPLVIKTDGTLWTWGQDSQGSLGQNQDGIDYSSPVQIGSGTDWDKVGTNSGGFLATAIKTDGALWVWGANQYGGLGQNQAPAQLTGVSSPIQIPGTWNSVNVTYGAIFGTKTDGTLWAWGNNGHGQLGQSNTTKYSSPVQVPGTTWDVTINSGSYCGGAIKTDGTMWRWGRNERGQLGLNDTIGYSSPKQVPGTDWSKVDTLAEEQNSWILRTL